MVNSFRLLHAPQEFLHGLAHEGIAAAVLAVWEEAEPQVSKLGVFGCYRFLK